MWMKIAAPYRWMRGTLRFKYIAKAALTMESARQLKDWAGSPEVKAQIANPQVEMFGFHTPYARWPKDLLEARQIQYACYSWMNFNPDDVGYDGPGVGRVKTEKMTAGGMPRSCFNSDTGVLEFEVPHISIYNFLLARTGGIEEIDHGFDSVHSNGMTGVGFAVKGPNEYTLDGTNYFVPEYQYYVNTYAAVGDDWHFGGYLGAGALQTPLQTGPYEQIRSWPDVMLSVE
jgi:hypothetical protein